MPPSQVYDVVIKCGTLQLKREKNLFSSLHHLCRANSVAWNPHKMLMAGIQCCALLVKDSSVSSPFIFQMCLGYVFLLL